MSAPVSTDRVRRRNDDGEEKQEGASLPQSANQTAGAAEAVSQPASTAANADGAQPLQELPQSADVRQPSEQSGRRTEPRQLPRLVCHLDKLAKVELQICLQFLDTTTKLIAARCSRSLLHAADHPLAWQGHSAAFGSRRQPQLGSLIRRSLLRHAPIALTLDSDLPVEEVASIPHVRELIISVGISADLIHQLLLLPSLQGLQTLWVRRPVPESTLQLLSTLASVHTLMCCAPNDPADPDWSWLPAMPALTDLELLFSTHRLFPQRLVDAIGQCARLQSLQLDCPRLEADVFARLCSTPSMRQLRHLSLAHFRDHDGRVGSPEYGEGFSTLERLESLRLVGMHGVNQLLPHLAHAPALRTLSVACGPDCPVSEFLNGSSRPRCEWLDQLLSAAPLLEVRLEMASSLDEWRTSKEYRTYAHSPFFKDEMDDQWRELQRMAEEMERVTIVDSRYLLSPQ